MGIGAAAIMPSTLSVITTSFDEKERGKAVGVWVGVAGGGGVLGLFGTAILLEFFNWSSFFLLNFTMAALGLIGTLRFIKDSKDSGEHSLDVAGGLISVLGVSSLVFGIIEGPERGWGDYLTVTTLIVGALALISFIFWELHVKNPLLDPRLFKNRGFSGGALSITIQFFGQFGFLFVGMQYLQFVAGFSALGAVLHLLPLPFVMLPMSRFAGANANRIPQKYMGSFGLAFFALGMFMFARMDSDFSLIWFTSSLIIFAFGMALAAVPATTAITNSLSANKQGVASAVNDTSREFGSAIGIAVLGAALNNQYRTGVSGISATLPPDMANNVINSVAFTQSTPPPALAAHWDVLVTTALDAFTHGMSLALNIGGAFALIGAVLVFAVAPKKVGKASSD
jgi:predicted MFS family arabinose efflux permease